MPEPPLDTAHLHDYVRRWRGGDRGAADELLMACADRLESLARRMLRGYPAVRGQAETGDVLQGCLIRLLNALRSVCPASTRAFYNFAEVQVRRELIDLARHFACRPAVSLDREAEVRDGALHLADEKISTPEDLELWGRFHREVEGLPAEQREVVGLAFYHGWTHTRIADLLGVDERTVRRRWRAAVSGISERMGGDLPNL